ncbi:hypothetical protein AB0L59_40115 [Streptomyces sp. NPDC052109]|uniref:hypothetical protein n=1 Tax=Streptomyces sp. NPDC052109 TaxID=3155527 RepID=UPI00341547C3
MSASPAVRALRAAVFAAVCVLLAAAGHGLAMGAMPPLGADGAGFLAVFALGWILGGRERSLPGIGAVMLFTQAGLHLGFDAAQSGRTGLWAAHMAVMPGPAMGTMPAHGMAPMQAHAVAPIAPDHVMAHAMVMSNAHSAAHPHLTAHATATHLLAALAASWWLRRGEAALWSLLRRAAALVPGLTAWWRDTPLPDPAGPAPCVPAAPEFLRLTLLRHAVSRRGPPPPIPYSL